MLEVRIVIKSTTKNSESIFCTYRGAFEDLQCLPTTLVQFGSAFGGFRLETKK